MIDATPTVRVAERPADPKAAEELVLAGRVYAYVLLPEGLERGVKRGQAEPVVAYTNAQLLVPASLVRRDLLAATSTVSAGIELPAPARGRGDGGERPRAVRAGARGHPRPLQPPAQLRLLPLRGPLPDAPPRLRPAGRGQLRGLGAARRHGGGVARRRRGARCRARSPGSSCPRPSPSWPWPRWPWRVLFGRRGRAPAGEPALLLLGTLLFVLAYQAIGVLARRALRQPALRHERRRVPRLPGLRLRRHHLPHDGHAGLRPASGARCCP